MGVIEDLFLPTAATTIPTARRSVAGIAIAAIVVCATVGVAVVVRSIPMYIRFTSQSSAFPQSLEYEVRRSVNVRVGVVVSVGVCCAATVVAGAVVVALLMLWLYVSKLGLKLIGSSMRGILLTWLLVPELL